MMYDVVLILCSLRPPGLHTKVQFSELSKGDSSAAGCASGTPLRAEL